MAETQNGEPQKLFPDIEPSRKIARPFYESRRSLKYPQKPMQLVTNPEDLEAQVVSIQKIKESHSQQAEDYRIKYGKILDEIAPKEDQEDLERRHRNEFDFVREEIRSDKSPLNQKDVERALAKDSTATLDQILILGMQVMEKRETTTGFELFKKAEEDTERLGIKEPRLTYAQWKYHEEMGKYTKTEEKKLRKKIFEATMTRLSRPSAIKTTSKPR